METLVGQSFDPPRDGHPWAEIYSELKRAAGRMLVGERHGVTLGATDLVSEAFLRLEGHPQPCDRSGLLRLASHVIRHVLVDRARARHRRNRTLAPPGYPVGEVADPSTVGKPGRDRVDLVALDVALTRLTDVNPMAAEVVELRFFGGLTEGEAAATLGVGRRKVSQLWQYGRPWLHREVRQILQDWG